MATPVAHRRGPLPGLNTISEAECTPRMVMAESATFNAKVVPGSDAIWSLSELSTLNDNASVEESCSDYPSDEDSANDLLEDETCSVPEIPSPPSLRTPADKAFANSKNALMLTNLPRTLGASDLIRNLGDAGYRPVRDFDFLHVPMKSNGMNHGCGVIHLVDASTRNAFISTFQDDDTNSTAQRLLTKIRCTPLKESLLEDSGTSTCSADLLVEDRGNPDWMDARMVQLFKSSPNAVLLYNLHRRIDSSDLILELYDIGFHPVRDFDFIHVPLAYDGMNNGYGVINLIDTATRNAFISLVQRDTGNFGSVMLYLPQNLFETW